MSRPPSSGPAAGAPQRDDRDPVQTFGFWIKAWLIATLVGPMLIYCALIASSLADPASGVSSGEMATILFYTYVIGLPFGGAMAMIWAVLSWGLARLSGRMALIASVVIALVIPMVFLFTMNGVEGSVDDRDSLVLFALTGAFSALIGICVVLRYGRAAPTRTELPHD